MQWEGNQPAELFSSDQRTSPICEHIHSCALREKRFLATGQFFIGAAGDGAAPTMAYSGAQTPAVPTNGTAGAAGDTSRPYKWVGFLGAAHSLAASDVAICRGGW